MTTVTVRPYAQRDEARLRTIALQNFIEQVQEGQAADAEDPAAQSYLAHIIRIAEGDRGVLLVAEQGQQLIGFVCLTAPAGTAEGQEGQEGQEAYAFMSDLFVVPASRNQGVGSLLIREVEQCAREMGAGHIALRVAAGNTASRHFYGNKRYLEKFVVMSKAIDDA